MQSEVIHLSIVVQNELQRMIGKYLPLANKAAAPPSDERPAID